MGLELGGDGFQDFDVGEAFVVGLAEDPRDLEGGGRTAEGVLFLIDGPRPTGYTSRSMKLIKTLLPAFLLASCATTSTPTTPEQKFQRADKNGDGSVSRLEATNLIIADAFAMYDTNGDGFVSEAEFVASGGTPANFRKINKSGSGQISLAEAQASSGVFNTFVVSFDEADTNKDGKVTWVEYQSYLKRRDAAVR